MMVAFQTVIRINTFKPKLTKLECGPMPNVMAACQYRWRPLFNAAKFG